MGVFEGETIFSCKFRMTLVVVLEVCENEYDENFDEMKTKEILSKLYTIN